LSFAKAPAFSDASGLGLGHHTVSGSSASTPLLPVDVGVKVAGAEKALGVGCIKQGDRFLWSIFFTPRASEGF